MKKRLPFSLLTLLVFLAGCSPKSVEDYNTAATDTDTVRLLNQRAYGKVIFLIESRSGKNPADKETAFLLGQAYLGQAGLEPLKVAAAVDAAQDDSSADARAVFPACPTAALGPAKDADALCLLKRVYFHVPDPDVYEMTRARALLRSAYPDAAKAPQWVNVLVGSLEMASLIKRLGNVFLLAKHTADSGDLPTDEQLRWLARQLKEAVDEADQALQRADHTGTLISQLLTGSKEALWYDNSRDAIHWAEREGLDKVLEAFRELVLSPEDQTKYGPLLDKLRHFLDDQNSRIAGAN